VTLFDALTNPIFQNAKLSLHSVEVWSGKGTVVQATRDLGLESQPFDHNISKDQDIIICKGFLLALSYVLAIPFGGLLVMAPHCASFVFSNSSQCQCKCKNLAGDVSYPAVAAGNCMAEIAVFLFLQ
jgi:hypothetical protein